MIGDFLEYKGFKAKIEFSEEDDIYFGCIQGIKDTVCFDGKTILELEMSFHDSVEDYLELLAELGRKDNKGSNCI